MKTSEIIACLKANKKVDGYEISIVDKDSRELFYVLNHLEINRAVKTNKTVVEVYCMDKKTTGSSILTVSPSDDKKTLGKKINAAISKAKSSKNNYYPLAKKSKNINYDLKIKQDLNDIASNIGKAVLKANIYKDGWINSTEIFVSKISQQFINSNGIKHHVTSFKIEVECIPTWSNSKEEFELYKFYESNKINYAQITSEIDEVLNLAKDRSNAKKIKDVDLPKDVLVLVKNDMRDDLVSNFAAQLSYRSKFMKDSHYDLKQKVSNNQFDLIMKPEIIGCVGSKKFDQNGVTLQSKKIISKGIAVNNFGDIKYGYYLNEKNITGDLSVCELKAQGIDYSNKKHLIIENFSSPQLEDNSGYWGGEVRLARYFDGNKYIPLTDFSISGNIYEDIMDVEFSKDVITSPYYKGPKYFIFKNISIH